VIPGKILRFLEQRANVAFAGTRDRDLVPYGHRVSAWRVGADEQTLTVLTPEAFTTRLVESLEQNGAFAVTIEQFPSHETYQFKGRYLRQRPAAAADVELVDRIRQRFVRNVRTIYPSVPEAVFQAFILPPAVAVDFDVHEVFLQTPGPGAGTRLVPAQAP
jgi:hypothetical protein